MKDNLKGTLEAQTKTSDILSLISCCLNIKEQKWSQFSLESTTADMGQIDLFHRTTRSIAECFNSQIFLIRAVACAWSTWDLSAGENQVMICSVSGAAVQPS